MLFVLRQFHVPLALHFAHAQPLPIPVELGGFSNGGGVVSGMSDGAMSGVETGVDTGAFVDVGGGDGL